MNNERILNSVAFASELGDPTKNILQERIDKFKGSISIYEDDTTVFKAYIGEEDVYIVFRGTVNIFDVLTDIKFPPDICPEIFGETEKYVCVHKGFAEYYLASQKDVRVLVDKYRDKNIIFAGHSLGGAASRLAALDAIINLNYGNPINYIFGCPKLGNENFEDLFKNKITEFMSFKNRDDAVPVIPFGVVGFDYHDRIQVESKDHDWWATCGFGNYMDHMQWRYENAIYKYCTGKYYK